MTSSFFKKNNVRSDKRGFSLFETLVAIFLLMLAVAAAMSLTQKSLSTAYLSRDNVIASYLAQDAMEYVRAIRDHNYIVSNSGTITPWLTGLTGCIAATCGVDTTTGGAMFGCSGASCQLKFNSTTGHYNYLSGTASPFSREITLCHVGTGACGIAPSETYEMSIIITIKWKAGAFGDQTVVLRENISNWGNPL